MGVRQMAWLVLGLAGCPNTDAPDSGDDASPCEIGCTETLAAGCPAGPETEVGCVSTCEILLDEGCGATYTALLDCGVGEEVTCDGVGLPTVLACEVEETAFRDCLSQ